MSDDYARGRVNIRVRVASKPGTRRYSQRGRVDGPLLTPEQIGVFLAAWDATHDLDQAGAVANVSPRKRHWLGVLLKSERGVAY